MHNTIAVCIFFSLFRPYFYLFIWVDSVCVCVCVCERERENARNIFKDQIITYHQVWNCNFEKLVTIIRLGRDLLVSLAPLPLSMLLRVRSDASSGFFLVNIICMAFFHFLLCFYADGKAKLLEIWTQHKQGWEIVCLLVCVYALLLYFCLSINFDWMYIYINIYVIIYDLLLLFS